MKPSKWLIVPLFFAAGTVVAQTKNVIVEEIVARVNNEIVTREDLARARASVAGEARRSAGTALRTKCRRWWPRRKRTSFGT